MKPADCKKYLRPSHDDGNCFARCILPLLFIAISLLSSKGILAQLTVNNAVNATDGVQSVLLGDGVTVSNITFSGDNAQIGSFTCAGGCNLNIGYGLVMATGNIDQAPGNGSGSSSLGPSSGFGASDPDLFELSGNTLNDAAVLQFDFVSTGSTVEFNFVFGSEEYPEFVNAGFNDAFGFFLSGPGISGPYLNNAANIALIPNTTTPVTIDNLNANSYSTYYVDNNGTVGNNNVPECDGFTTVLTASAEVQCGATYHIKLAIADAGDTSWDSFVFLEAGSFASSELFSSFTPPALAPPGGGIYEGCETGYVNFTVPASPQPQTFNLEFSGTAINGTDLTLIPSQINFPANQTNLQIPITAIQDGVLEGNESFIITVAGATACGQDVEVEVVLSDLPALQVNVPPVTINCGQQAILTPAISGGLGNYVITWDTGYIGPELSVYPDAPTEYSFTITDTCGVTPLIGVGEVLFIDNPPLTLSIGPDQSLNCLTTIDMIATVGGGFGTYDYQWTANGNFISNLNAISLLEDNDQVISLIVTDDCGETITDNANVVYPPVPVNVNAGLDLSVTCIDLSTLTPTVSGGVGTYNYEWALQGGAVLGGNSSLNYQTDETVTIVLEVTDQCGNVGSDNVTLSVPQQSVALDLGPDLVTDCITNNTLSAAPSGGVGTYTYNWTMEGNPLGVQSTVNFVTGDDVTIAVVVVDQCGNTSTDQLEVSVPAVPVFVNAGEDITVTCLDVSNINAVGTGGVGTYSYAWTDNEGAISNASGFNYQANETQTVAVVITDQCGNTNSDVMMVFVPDVPVYASITNDTLICYGQSASIQGWASGGVGDLTYNWNNTGYSPLNVTTVYPETSQQVQLSVLDECGNSTSTSMFITVEDAHPFFTANYLDENTIEFTNDVPEGETFYWEFSDGGISYDENPIYSFDYSYDWSVVLYASSPLGCERSATQDYAPNGDIYVPNCFTPDNDGINDFLFVEGHDIKAFEWWIYNRWGELLFHSTDMSKPWDGAYKAGEHFVQDGIYTYKIIATGKRENTIEKSGSVLIIR